jgi:hypothetical protein
MTVSQWTCRAAAREEDNGYLTFVGTSGCALGGSIEGAGTLPEFQGD